MEKQTKNIISREKIEKKLRSDNRASLKVSTLAFLVTALVGILWVVLFIPFFFADIYSCKFLLFLSFLTYNSIYVIIKVGCFITIV